MFQFRFLSSKVFAAVMLFCCGLTFAAQPASRSEQGWRIATAAELSSLLPARAPVQQERIETEMRTASGITNGQGKFVAGVVLITAGYSADGKYSHFFLTQVPMKIGNFSLPPGAYVIGWEHIESGLQVKFYEAASGKPMGSIAAELNPASTRVESFRIWPPAEHPLMQIGRFTFAYRIGD
ncbi:hypothetical protein HNQ77_003955 [Silvibacterium bohemicum]|uniref:Uncharacterized protein n=1 Tax=Silvibacterium bohemicum TaxID=1577686 RepID=A0A841JZB5_9BACT|nr:hypothetical protein [Silvibacterium bohemicum]MBB6145985.1 hypothetical protein [Silvibacterium bohemicum]